MKTDKELAEMRERHLPTYRERRIIFPLTRYAHESEPRSVKRFLSRMVIKAWAWRYYREGIENWK